MILKVPEKSWDYLVNQRGRLWVHRNDRPTWLDKYNQDLWAELASIQGFLPDRVDNLLDIGSGLGGIDILLQRRLGCQVFLLDGEHDGPVVRLHREPFNDMQAAQLFFEANEATLAGYYTSKLQLVLLPYVEEPESFDLVVSFASWCFHFPPHTYLDWVLSKTQSGGRLVVDVRRNEAYFNQLNTSELRPVVIASVAPKFERRVYERS